MMSMTGYGRSSCQVADYHFIIEMRSVNHRFFDFKAKLPWNDAELESRLLEMVRSGLRRGAITVTVWQEDRPGTPGISINAPLAKRYQEALVGLAKTLGLPETDVTLSMLLGLRGVLGPAEPSLSAQARLDAVREGVGQALDRLLAMRQQEGEAIRTEFHTRVRDVSALMAQLKALATEAPESHRKRLHERMERILGVVQPDPQRLAQEIALWVDRTDTAEEIARMELHLAEIGRLCDENGAVGRKLDFVLQELGRECNTLGSKAQSGEMSAGVIDVKAEIERMREQAQNVE